MHFAEHVAKVTPEPGHKPEPPPQPGPPTWRRKPGDDIETPAWALRCLSTFLAPGTHVYDPFYSTGSVKAHWRKLGYDCTHRRVDYRDPATRPEGLDSGAVTLATYAPYPSGLCWYRLQSAWRSISTISDTCVAYSCSSR